VTHPDYSFNSANRWLDQQDNYETMKFSAKVFSDALADLVVEPAKHLMPKRFAQWTGRLWAVMAAYVAFVFLGNLLMIAAPLVVSVLIPALLVTLAAGFIAQRIPAVRNKISDLAYEWRTR
jgi:hypothetical protein